MERLMGIVGSMFSGKTEELLRRVKRAEIAEREVQVFKPKLDDRWGKVQTVRSHAGSEHSAVAINNSREILDNITRSTKMVAIEEVQFLDSDIVSVIQILLGLDIEVNFAGLPLDFRGEPFGSVPTLLALADDLTRLTAICTYKDNGEICGADATKTQRLVNGKPACYTDPIILVGAEESYSARCPDHHIVPGKPRREISKA